MTAQILPFRAHSVTIIREGEPEIECASLRLLGAIAELEAIAEGTPGLGPPVAFLRLSWDMSKMSMIDRGLLAGQVTKDERDRLHRGLAMIEESCSLD